MTTSSIAWNNSVYPIEPTHVEWGSSQLPIGEALSCEEGSDNMDSFTREHLKSLIQERTGPCVSIFTKTAPGGGGADPIRWRCQLDDAEDRLVETGMGAGEAAELTGQARILLKKPDYWRKTSQGLATFLASGCFEMFRLPSAFASEVFVGPHFHIKPLLPWFSTDGRFYILALSQNRIRLFEATSHHVKCIATPPNMREALRTHDRDEVLNYHTHEGASGRGMEAIFNGHGVGIDDHKTDLLRYFQVADHAVRERLAGSSAPLVLASVAYLAPIYRKASKYPAVIEEIISGNPDHWSEAELHAKALPLVQSYLNERAERLAAQYRQLAGTGQTSHDLQEILPAAAKGEVQTLLLAPGQQVWGTFEAATERLERRIEPQIGDEELTNLAAIYMLQRGRAVHIMPEGTDFDGDPAAGVFFMPLVHHGNSLPVVR